MARSTADDVLEIFQNRIFEVDDSKVMQVSFDGTNVNLTFLKEYISMREEKELDLLMDLGTCKLHVVHDSIKAGAKAREWELHNLCKAMWQFIHDAPTRRGMYKNILVSIDYPSKFCGHRCYKNKKCAEKEEYLIKGYQKFVTHVFIVRKNHQPDSKKKGFIVLKKMIHDPLTSLKLRFFEMVSHMLNAFLRSFQTDSTMFNFFADVLGGNVHNFLERIILKDVLRKATNLQQLVQIDPLDKNIRKSTANIDICFPANIKVE